MSHEEFHLRVLAVRWLEEKGPISPSVYDAIMGIPPECEVLQTKKSMKHFILQPRETTK